MKSRSEARSLFIATSLFITFWILWHWRIYFDSRLLLPEDNFKTHFNLFSYLYGYLTHFRAFPDWVYTREGGMALAPLSNNYLTLIPYRAVGLLAALTTEISSVLAYKVSFLIFGQGIFLFGIYLCVSSWLESQVLGWWAVLLTLVTAPILSLLHQEQVLGTTLLLPFLWWAIFKFKKEKKFLFLIFSLTGWGLNFHYPQLQIVYWGLVLLSALAFQRRQLFSFQQNLSGLPVAVLLLLASSSPLLFSYWEYKDKLVSPFREQGQSLEAETYDQYLELNRQQASSVVPDNFLLYLARSSPTINMAPLDRNTFFLTPFILAGLLWFLIRERRKALFLSMITLGLLFCAMGIYGPMPRILWPILPGLKLFRQWFHFVPILNLHLLFFFLWALKDVRQRFGAKPAYAVFILTFGWGAIIGLDIFDSYDRYFVRVSGERLEGEEASRFIQRTVWEENSLYEPLFVKFKGTYGAEWNGKDRFFLEDNTGMQAPLKGNDVIAQPFQTGFRFQFMRPIGSSLNFNLMQWNDGRWSIQAGGPVPADTNRSGAVRASLPAWVNHVEVTRVPSIWRGLILLPFISVAISIAMIRRRKASK